MKKHFIALLATCILFVAAPIAQGAQFGFYISPKLGIDMQNGDKAKFSSAYRNTSTSSFLHADSRFALAAGVSIGYDWNFSAYVPVRTELELMFRTRTSTKNTWAANNVVYSAEQKTGVNTLFANVYYDLFTATSFTPYFGGGIGMAQVRQNLESGLGTYAESSNHFAFNVGLGLSWVLSGDFVADLGYRYIYPVSKYNQTYTALNGTTISSQIRPTSHEVVLGLRYTF